MAFLLSLLAAVSAVQCKRLPTSVSIVNASGEPINRIAVIVSTGQVVEHGSLAPGESAVLSFPVVTNSDYYVNVTLQSGRSLSTAPQALSNGHAYRDVVTVTPANAAVTRDADATR